MNQPGEPVNPDPHWRHSNIPWTGVRSFLGVPYAYPEWHMIEGTGTILPDWDIIDKRHGIRWTLRNTRTLTFAGDVNRWVLTETLHGWSARLAMDVSRRPGATLRIADTVVRNVANMPDVITKGHRPVLQPSVEKRLEGAITWWQSP